MNDTNILAHITELVDEEQRLRAEDQQQAGGHVERLQRIEEELDQCWDLLRQRRAKREFGQNPDAAEMRDVKTVESYLN